MRKLTATKQIHTRTKKTKGQERGEALTCHWSCRYRTNGPRHGGGATDAIGPAAGHGDAPF